MKSWTVKLGKGLHAIKREGVLLGGKRSATAFFKMFRRVGEGDILFVSSGVGDSARYRSHNQSEELALHGFKCAITVQENPFLQKYVDRFKIFFFQKILFTPTVAKMVEEIKKQKKEIIFETDDLVYDPQFTRLMAGYEKMNKLEKPLYENGLGGEILRDPYVKAAVTTTSFLADKLRKEGKVVFVSKNKLTNHDLEIVADVEKQKAERTNGIVRLGYFSGTASHDKDFATIVPAVKRILDKYRQTELWLFGPLEIDKSLKKYGKRVKQMPFYAWKKHLANISNIDINLAPLEIGNPFCEAKSELKFFEAGILGVPTIATATQTFKEAIDDGVDGFIAGNVEEWANKLETLVLDKSLRQNMGKEAKEIAYHEHTNKNSHNSEYYNYLRLVLGADQ